jgi:[ribosomal protein S5]-alanine N-acetyltransferase
MIQTKRLQFVACEKRHLEAFSRGRSELTTVLQVTLPDSWPTFPEAFSLPDNPPSDENQQPDEWGGFFFIQPQDRVLVGNGGFHGTPDATGCVEIGYEIASEYWNRGFATEAVRGMLDYAFTHEQIKAVIAHTLAVSNASNNVLQKVGMTFVEEIDAGEEGKIWQWRINKEDYRPTDHQNG